MNVLSSLTNRIFFASALLLLVTIGIAVYRVTVAVTEQAQTDLQNGLHEAASFVNQYSRRQFADFLVKSSLITTLPKLAAVAETQHAPTVKPIAEEYRRMAAADLFVVLGRKNQVLANVGRIEPDDATLGRIIAAGRASKDGTSFHVVPGGLVHTVALPIGAGLGTLVVGYSFDRDFVSQIKAVTDSDIALVADSTIVASTLDPARTAQLSSDVGRMGTFTQQLGGEEFIGSVQPLGESSGPEGPVALVLRSRTERLRFLSGLHWQFALTGLAAVGVATLIAYGIARTVTRPVRALTATMREMAATGDLARAVPQAGRWDDEDARLLGTTFGQLATALDRFRRESAQRERLSSLGRLSAVVAHEIRNPLMIIKSSVRTLRQRPDTAEVARSIDEEVRRLDKVISGVLDIARPIRFDLAPAELGEICRDATDAACAVPDAVPVSLDLPAEKAPLVTDAERLRAVLVNVLTNAQEAVRARQTPPAGKVRLTLRHSQAGRERIEVADTGAGIAPENLPRLFEPFFTTRRTGSGLGLPIARNIIEGLGGTIAIDSRPGEGTRVVIEVPSQPPLAEGRT
jgi:signal transduction histidine kinase